MNARWDWEAARQTLPPGVVDGPLLVLSPHLDDAALSCSALIERDRPATILTAFDGEPDPPQAAAWDLLTGFSGSTDSMAARRQEDRAAFAGTPHDLAGLGLLDLQYCGARRSPTDRSRIETAIRAWIDRVEEGTVAAPAGAGRHHGSGRLRSWLETRVHGAGGGVVQHPDHVLVRDAAVVTALDSPSVGLLLYEELPYLWGAGAESELTAVLRGVERSCVPINVEIDREAKARRIGAYRSQVDHLAVGDSRVERASDLPETERYWYLPAARAPSSS